MKLTKKQQEEMFQKLPELCYGILNSTNEIIILKRGEKGYYPTDYNPAKTFNKKFKNFTEARKAAETWCNELNEGLGVTKAQRKAMEVGSMFGFDVPGINPEYYDVEK